MEGLRKGVDVQPTALWYCRALRDRSYCIECSLVYEDPAALRRQMSEIMRPSVRDSETVSEV